VGTTLPVIRVQKIKPLIYIAFIGYTLVIKTPI
jgi:hypothetical protein